MILDNFTNILNDFYAILDEAIKGEFYSAKEILEELKNE